MSVLSDVDLKRILNQDEGIIILRRREKSITSVGYDLTIGFIRDAVTGKIPETFIDDDNVARYTLLAGHRYLVISKEFIYLSSKYMATLHSRGSYALKGIIVTSTTVDPNYAGCITGSLFICSLKEDIHIKKENQFATMVFHELHTPTNSFLQINERGNPMDTQETFHSRYPNIHPNACSAGDAYYGQVRKAVEPEFLDALKRMYQKNEINTKTNKKINKKTQISEAEKVLKEAPASKEKKSLIEMMPPSKEKSSSIKTLPPSKEKTPSTETLLKKNSEESSQETIKVTFLIGNGFDLNIGLKTRYKDFYPYYFEEYSNDLLAEDIRKNIEDWSDLESKLGQVTSKITSEKKEAFFESDAHLESSLVNYLRKEMEHIHLEAPEVKGKIAYEVHRSLLMFYEYHTNSDMQSIKNLLGTNKNLIEYSFITFNYTDMLDQCLNTMGTRSSLTESFSIQSPIILHVHGSIDDGSIVLGVNDENQIANPGFRDNDSQKLLVKSCINKSFKNTRKEQAEAIIRNSNIICIFGMSLGKTDQTWWQEIANWLQQESARQLIIFSKEDKISTSQKAIMIQEQNVSNTFFINGNISDDMRSQIEKQIHVIINADLFDIRLV